MGKFNTKNKNETLTVNRAGGEAYTQSPKLALVSLLLTSFVKNQYYRTEDEIHTDVSNLLDMLPDKKFAAKAAIYARTKFGMRSISHLVAGQIAERVKGETWTKDFFNKVVFRPDDMSEILAYYYSRGNKNEPNALKKGFAQALAKMDEYKLAKYKKDGAAVSMIDIVNLVHPKETPAIKALMTGTLKAPETWEVEMTKTKGDETLKKEVWEKLIRERKLGYFALLRNLRNIVEQSPEVLDEALEMFTDENLIKKSLVLPFRFMTAIKQLEEDGIVNNKLYVALNKALETSFANVPHFDGKTLVVVDHSGSMDSGEHGNMTNFEIGAMFAVSLAKSNDADFLYFGDDARYYTINPLDSTTTLVKVLNGLNEGSTEVGHGTNFHSIFETANKAYDRIIIFSDMQGWSGYDAPVQSYADYRKRTGANPKIYSIDLTGYGDMQFAENQIYCLAGFSDKLFDLMKLLETDRNIMINEIEKVEL